MPPRHRLPARYLVMFSRHEDVEADLLGVLGDGDHRLDALMLGGRLPCGRVDRHVADGEDFELHVCS